jgi:hypothetical protein
MCVRAPPKRLGPANLNPQGDPAHRFETAMTKLFELGVLTAAALSGLAGAFIVNPLLPF